MKSLREVLTECSETQLEQIAQLWAIGNAPAKDWTHHRTHLEQGMRDTISARFVWDHLAEDERLVLYNILGPSARNWVVRDDLPKKMQLSAARYKSALERVKRLSLVLEVLAKVQGNQLVDHRLGFYSYGDYRKLPIQAVDILYVPVEIATFLYMAGREFFAQQSDRSKLTLEKILAPLHQSDLDEVGQHYGIEMDGSYYTRTDYRSVLAASLVQPEAVTYALQQLDATSRNLFTLLYERGGKLSLQAARAFTGFDDATISIILRTLTQYAVTFDTFSDREHVLFIPIDTYKNLKTAPAESAESDQLILSESVPPAVRPGETIILYDLATIIGAVHQQDIEPTKMGTVPKRIATKIEPMLHGCPRIAPGNDQENGYLEMLFDIAQELGLLQLSRSAAYYDIKEHYEPGPVLKQWSQMDTVEQTRRLLQLWIGSGHWGDIVGASYREWYSGYVDHKAVRGSLAAHVRKSTPKQWYTVASLLHLIRGRDPFALRPRQRTVASLGYRKASELREHWDTCDREIVIGSLSSSLYELGIVALGYQEPKALEANEPINPDFFMLTDLGATVLSPAAKPASANTTISVQDGNHPLVVQPSFELLLLQPDLAILYGLLPFAQIKQVGVVSRLLLTRESIIRGVASGMSVEQMLQLLETCSQKGVPQNVAYTLNDWAKLYKGMKVSSVILLEVTSEAVANEICTRLQAFGLRRIGPCAIAASNEINVQELRRALDKMGIVAHIGVNNGAAMKAAPTNGKVAAIGKLR
jgi:Helicase conserved C-terminal domain